MNWDQVSIINKHDLFQIGGHSHSHFSLGMLNEKDMIKEITDSITMLRRKANVISEHYSYPEGQFIDYNQKVISVLKNYNIKCCPTAVPGLNDLIPENLFELKRFNVS